MDDFAEVKQVFVDTTFWHDVQPARRLLSREEHTSFDIARYKQLTLHRKQSLNQDWVFPDKSDVITKIIETIRRALSKKRRVYIGSDTVGQEELLTSVSDFLNSEHPGAPPRHRSPDPVPFPSSDLGAVYCHHHGLNDQEVAAPSICARVGCGKAEEGRDPGCMGDVAVGAKRPGQADTQPSKTHPRTMIVCIPRVAESGRQRRVGLMNLRQAEAHDSVAVVPFFHRTGQGITLRKLAREAKASERPLFIRASTLWFGIKSEDG